MTSPDPKPPEVFKASDFDRTRGWGPNDGVLSPEQAMRDANAKLAPLIEALHKMDGFHVDASHSLGRATRDVLTAFRRLVGQENSGEVKT